MSPAWRMFRYGLIVLAGGALLLALGMLFGGGR